MLLLLIWLACLLEFVGVRSAVYGELHTPYYIEVIN